MTRKLSRWTYHLMLARVPLVGILVLLLFAVLGGSGPPTISNMLLMDGPLQLFLGVFVACQLASLCGLLALITWRVAPARFGAHRLALPAFLRGDSALRGLPCAALALPLVLRMWVRNWHRADLPALSPVRSSLAVLAGLAAAALVLVVIERLRHVLVRRFLTGPTQSPNFLVRFTRRLGPGYYDRGAGRVEPGHALATTTLLVLGTVYAALYWVLHPADGHQAWAPTLAYVLGLVMLVVSLLSGAAFYLDRYRVPLLLAVVAYVAVAGHLAPLDHFFRVRALTSKPPSITRALDARFELQGSTLAADRPRVLTIVTSAGGGIQSAAWTARVLAGIQQELVERSGEQEGEDFARSIYLTSAVSGGSVGLFFYLQSFDPARGAPPATSLDRSLRAARNSSLEATAWGLIFPDLQRAFVPLVRGNLWLDRAWAMERSWLQASQGTSKVAGDGPWMSQWMNAAETGSMPGVIFNSTTVEDGRQLRLSNLDLAPLSPMERRDANAGEQTQIVKTSARLLKNRDGQLLDLPAVSAARLSATFPYVTPVARARCDDGTVARLDGYHFADGGYFDNFGVVSALEWLLELRRNTSRLDAFDRIVVIQINGFPEPATAEAETTPHGLAGEAGAAAEAESSKSWWFATAAPFTTLTKVLTSTQVARNLLELGMLAEAFETGPRPVKLDSFSFRPPARDPDEPDPPLSWYLSPSDQRRLDTDWESADNREELDRLIEVFRAPPAAEIESAEPAGTAPGSDGP
ncbi:MAG: patatin-like phospholipase family protein [Acidobacteria bacterium]|nr:patatin-like phospholipase family protein [Acidobacteriota bacterium]